MFRTLIIGMFSALAVTLPVGTWAQQDQFATALEAKAMLERAVTAVKSDKAAALDKFKKGEDGFKDRDLYVFCMNSGDGVIVSGPESVMGKDARTLVDNTGNRYGEKIYREAKDGSINEVSYMSPRPGSPEPVAKRSHITKVSDLICSVGYYSDPF